MIEDKAKALAANHFKGKGAYQRALKWLQDALRDGCEYCDCELTLDNIQLDHYFPKNPSKTYPQEMINFVETEENFKASCKDCNLAKGALTGGEYIYLLKALSAWEEDEKSNSEYFASGNATVKYILNMLKKTNSRRGKI